MQGRDDGQREFGDAESLAGHLLPAGSVFAFLAEHRQRLFPDGAFADLFTSGRGRPSILADVIASVMVLQALHGLSDRQTAEAVTFDLRWKAACGFAVTETGFHPSVLTYWRRTITGRDPPRRGPGSGRRAGPRGSDRARLHHRRQARHRPGRPRRPSLAGLRPGQRR